MSVSIDQKKLDKLVALEATLELLQDSSSYTRMLHEVKAAIKEYKEVAQRFATIEAAEQFLSEAHRVLTKAKEQATHEAEEAQKAKYAFETKVATEMRELAAKRAYVDQLVASNEQVSADLKKEQAKLVEDSEVFEKHKTNVMARLQSQAEALARDQRELNEKLSKLKQLMV